MPDTTQRDTTPSGPSGTGSPQPQPQPAGWYPDPDNAAARRFWDGAAWTEHTRGEAVAARHEPRGVAPRTAASRAPVRVRASRTRLAIAGVVVAALVAVAVIHFAVQDMSPTALLNGPLSGILGPGVGGLIHGQLSQLQQLGRMAKSAG